MTSGQRTALLFLASPFLIIAWTWVLWHFARVFFPEGDTAGILSAIAIALTTIPCLAVLFGKAMEG